jgi:Zn-dependent M28 family amino/carboxypeptidase
MKRGNRTRCLTVISLTCLMGLLAGACGGDVGTDEDADAEVEVIDDGREDVPADPPRDDGVQDEVTPDPMEDPDMVQPDVPDGDEDVEEPDAEPPVDCTAIHESITADGLLVHLTELAGIAADNDNNRASGTGGWDDSVRYVQDTLAAAGYAVTQTAFGYPYFELVADPLLERTAPTARTYTFAPNDNRPVGDFQKVYLSPPGDVTAHVTAVDLELGPGNTSTSGCEVGDFAGFTAGHIALIQRGECYFVEKAMNAQAAGASGVLLFNQGDTAAREGLMTGGLAIYPLDSTSPDHGVVIPVLFATYAVGEELAGMITSGDTVTLHMQVNTIFEVRETQNLVTETAGGSADEVMIFGAHLDSVPEGPGINDNGSGVAALLEIARVVAGCDPVRQIRFAFWGAEEWGLWGSTDYAVNLTDAELGRIHSYINADMIGSVNYTIFVFDGDGSSFDVPGPPGSAEIERFFQNDMLALGLSSVPYFTDRSDHWPLFSLGVANGSLFTGADGIKTAEEADAFGGTAGETHDPCYHQACDTLSNVDLDIAETMTKSMARAAQFFGVDGLDTPP